MEKSCSKHFCTKNAHVKCWWNWPQVMVSTLHYSCHKIFAHSFFLKMLPHEQSNPNKIKIFNSSVFNSLYFRYSKYRWHFLDIFMTWFVTYFISKLNAYKQLLDFEIWNVYFKVSSLWCLFICKSKVTCFLNGPHHANLKGVPITVSSKTYYLGSRLIL